MVPSGLILPGSAAPPSARTYLDPNDLGVGFEYQSSMLQNGNPKQLFPRSNGHLDNEAGSRPGNRPRSDVPKDDLVDSCPGG